MKTYPEVQSEMETVLRLQRTGESLLRIGDGEIKMLYNSGNKYEAYHSLIRAGLMTALNNTPENIAIAIPRPMPISPRFEWWGPHVRKLLPFLHKEITYGSSFITRPDQAPYIADKENWFREEIAKLWAGERTMLVGSGASMATGDFKGAIDFHFYETPDRDAIKVLDEIREHVADFKPKVLVLCAGMAVKTLVPEFDATGIRTYDLGSFGKRKHWAIGREILKELPR